MTNSTNYRLFQTKCRLSELNARVCDRMCLQGLQDPALFGLAIPIGKWPLDRNTLSHEHSSLSLELLVFVFWLW